MYFVQSFFPRFYTKASQPSLLVLPSLSYASPLYRSSSLLSFLYFSKRSIATSPNLCFSSSSTSDSNSSSKTPSSCPSSFPCLDELDAKTARLKQQAFETHASSTSSNSNSLSGPEPTYTTFSPLKHQYQVYTHSHPIFLDLGGHLPSFQLAYETWGTLNQTRSNAILLHTGLSASAHAKSHASNPSKGWWESMIGPNAPLNTNDYFIICSNVLGGCFGSTGPSSLNPLTQQPYATHFPFVTLWDMVKCQHALIQSLGIEKLWASVGCSMGGMQSLAYTALYPNEVQKLISISSCAKAHPYSIALRFVQRQIIMSDPAYSSTRGHYYQSIPPHIGMQLARELATITYRSGPEWEERFGRKRLPTMTDATQQFNSKTTLCPDFEIENYLTHQGEKFSLNYDANSLLYISKAMDLFDMSLPNETTRLHRERNLDTPPLPSTHTSSSMSDALSEEEALVLGMQSIHHPTLILGVTSDCLFPLHQQKELVQSLKKAGNQQVTFYTLDSIYGHDTFLIDVIGVGAAIRGHLS